ncbi:hypothetical protein TRFO_05408 [Tritrichomonas foetus]|uniref:CUE domain-containing protein n=1 Tax=Tritrichomonas foetus TaxID=1144522 RepID=A0A1J4KB98_9EUKA|nr:hypothetical protein TRFO_05408 [Tritrichomonas foetus]|eukprot:OHT06741.1 hypothetical protein TRFO_05408 [Tritrichomonas foetus]
MNFQRDNVKINIKYHKLFLSISLNKGRNKISKIIANPHRKRKIRFYRSNFIQYFIGRIHHGSSNLIFIFEENLMSSSRHFEQEAQNIKEMFPDIDYQVVIELLHECRSVDDAIERILTGDAAVKWKKSKSNRKGRPQNNFTPPEQNHNNLSSPPKSNNSAAKRQETNISNKTGSPNSTFSHNSNPNSNHSNVNNRIQNRRNDSNSSNEQYLQHLQQNISPVQNPPILPTQIISPMYQQVAQIPSQTESFSSVLHSHPTEQHLNQNDFPSFHQTSHFSNQKPPNTSYEPPLKPSLKPSYEISYEQPRQMYQFHSVVHQNIDVMGQIPPQNNMTPPNPINNLYAQVPITFNNISNNSDNCNNTHKDVTLTLPKELENIKPNMNRFGSFAGPVVNITSPPSSSSSASTRISISAEENQFESFSSIITKDVPTQLTSEDPNNSGNSRQVRYKNAQFPGQYPYQVYSTYGQRATDAPYYGQYTGQYGGQQVPQFMPPDPKFMQPQQQMMSQFYSYMPQQGNGYVSSGTSNT